MRPAHAILLIYYGALLSLPLILYGFPSASFDGVIHEMWATHFSDQIWAGELYPRWLRKMNDGLGSPVFFFYGPIPFWATSLFRPFSGFAPYAWMDLGLSAALGLIASGFTCFLWLRSLTNERSALAGGILYMVMPYHLAIDLYTRGAVGEFFAFVWMPAVLLHATKVAYSGPKRGAFFGIAVSYACLIMTHLPTTLMFSLLPVCVVLVGASSGRKIQSVMFTIGAMTVGIALSAVYLLPAMMCQEYVSMEAIRVGSFYYKNNFFLSRSLSGRIMLAADGTARHLFWLSIAILLVGVICYCVSRRDSRHVLLWLCVACLAELMMLSISNPLWVILKPLPIIQHPWRFNAILTVAVIALFALALDTVRRPSTKYLLCAVVSAISIVPLWNGFGLRASFSTAFGPASEKRGLRITERDIDVPEYRPRTAAANRYSTFQAVGTFCGTNNVTILSGSGSVTIESWKGRELKAIVNSAGELLVQFRHYYYPGWVGQIDAGNQIVTVNASVPHGLIEMVLPEGRYHLRVVLTATLWERLGCWITAVSVLAVIIIRFVPGGVWSRVANLPLIDQMYRSALR